jgi:arylamine N-acetyltransferase
MDVTANGAFRRLVEERKGSYCFGQNGLLLGMLRGLGYRYVYFSVIFVSLVPRSWRYYFH